MKKRLTKLNENYTHLIHEILNNLPLRRYNQCSRWRECTVGRSYPTIFINIDTARTNARNNFS